MRKVSQTLDHVAAERIVESHVRSFNKPLWGLPMSLGLILAYWLASVTEPTSFPAIVTHAVTGAIMALFTVGHSLRIAALGRPRFEPVSLVGRVAFDLVSSFVFITLTSCVLSVFYLLNSTNLAVILGAAIVGSNGIEIARQSFSGGSQRITAAGYANVGVIATFGIFVSYIFRRAFIWPSMPGWDTYVHLGVSNWILSHDGLRNLFPVADGSWLPYPYVFHVVIATYSIILGVAPYTVFWFGPFYLIPMYGLLVYSLTSVLSESRLQSLFAALLSMSISGGESLLGPQYLVPSTLFIMMFMVCLVAIMESPLRGVEQAAFSMIALSVCFSIYYYPLFLTLVPLMIFQIKRNPSSFLGRRRVLFLIASIATALLLTYIGSLLLSGLTLPLILKTEIIGIAYPDVLWALIILGALVVVHRFSKNRVRYFSDISLLMYVVAFVAVYFLPLSGSTRSELLLRPFAAIVASYIMAIFGVALSRASSKLSVRCVGRFLNPAKLSIRISLVVFLAASLALLLQPYVSYGGQVPGWSNISNDEFQAANWLEQNTPMNGYILTDPSTGFVLRGLTLLNSSTSFIIEGHTPSPQRYPLLESTVYRFFTSLNITQIPAYLSELPQAPNFVVLTTRTASWASWGGINSTFPAPTHNLPDSFAGFQKFDSRLFTLTASWDTVRIYRLTGTAT